MKTYVHLLQYQMFQTKVVERHQIKRSIFNNFFLENRVVYETI